MEAVTTNEDLLTEILVRLPPKSLIRFKSVSKTWLRLVSCTKLRRCNSQRLSKDIYGLVRVPMYSTGSRPYFDCKFIPINGNGVRRNSPLERLNFVPGVGKLEVISHCNGLLLCSTELRLDVPYTGGVLYHQCYVFNPTTKEYATVSADRTIKLGDKYALLATVNLAFDPRKSLHYKLLFIYRLIGGVVLRIYSSDTGVIRQIDEPFSSHSTLLSIFSRGVYWNGAVNWPSYHISGSYFNFEEERCGLLPTLPVPEDVENSGERVARYVHFFGESNDHLHLIESYGRVSAQPTLQFDIYEMDRGYSRWFLRFRVDLQALYGSLRYDTSSLIHMPGRHCGLIVKTEGTIPRFPCLPRGFGVMSIVRRDDDEESFLVVSIPGKLFRYHFKDSSFKKIGTVEKGILYDWMDSIPFIESLYCL